MFVTNQMQTDFHEHYAATLAISLDRNILIETKEGEEEYRAALLTPNTYHRTVSPGVTMLALLIDPETYEYKEISDIAEKGKIKKLDIAQFELHIPKIWDMFNGILKEEEVWNLHLDLLQSVRPFQKFEITADDRIERIAHKIRTEIPDSIRMTEIGKDFAVSEDRLIRLFKEKKGIPLRRYLLWVRILEAAKLLKDGMNLTEAAHAAGFSDSAHFTRTFKENFGFVPSLFFGHLRSMDVFFCEPN
ncbi:AraC family transcriptional regulator [Leptospira sp. GIMC2001]|uniref:AraC family transcriptional regulator n=1 Tax=Leptospira sp. GIMC2001 TaxID=1513297 RepID=UPI00234BDA62|nr:AraC family transcriptional regulator [Leptospira sp. GIMC2001]WCL51425.1 AraC family transcriptional regulator [Leptospira sp. GIMC2001]